MHSGDASSQVAAVVAVVANAQRDRRRCHAREAKAHASPSHGFRLLLSARVKVTSSTIVGSMRMATVAMSASASGSKAASGVKG